MATIRGKLFPARMMVGGQYRTVYFVWNGEKRPPKHGEHFLSGAIPEVYDARNDLTTAYYIMVPYEVQLGEKVIDGAIYIPRPGGAHA